MTVEVWTWAFGKLIWFGRLGNVPRAGDVVTLPTALPGLGPVEEVHAVRFDLERDVAQVMLATPDESGMYAAMEGVP